MAHMIGLTVLDQSPVISSTEMLKGRGFQIRLFDPPSVLNHQNFSSVAMFTSEVFMKCFLITIDDDASH